MTAARWLATFFSVGLGSACVLVAAWAVGLVVAPHEEIHLEYAVPALVLATAGFLTAVLLWRRGL